MKYERLTERDERGFPCIKGVSPENLYKGFDDMNEAVSVTWAVKRLAELEDKIESRELVEVPKGVVVLTPEERAEEMRLANEERKEAMKAFGERVKMAFYYEFDELIPSIMADRIDELVAESLANELKPFIREE